MFGRTNKKTASGYDPYIDLTTTLSVLNNTFTADRDGILSAYVRITSGQTGYWYLADQTTNATVCVLYGTSGDYLTNAVPIAKGHTYKVTAYANISQKAFTLYPFK